MTAHTINTDTPALLKKSQVVQQISLGPTLNEVATELLRQALKEQFPERDIDPEQTLIGTPQWRWLDGTLVAMPARFESLSRALIRQFATSATANYLEGEHFLTVNPSTTPVVHLDIAVEAIARLLNDYAPLLFVAFGEQQLAYWNRKGQHAPHWQELSASLRKTLDVQNVNGWDETQCRVARAVALNPDKPLRQSHDPTLAAIRVSLIDIDSIDSQGNSRHQVLGGAAVITGRHEERELVMMYSTENGYETFDSLDQLGASLPERIDPLPPGHNLKWQLFEPEGNFFDHMAWALITTQLDAIRSVTDDSFAAQGPDTISAVAVQESTSAQDKLALLGLVDAIPDWLFGASATDLDHYSQSINALGKLYKQADKKLLRIPAVDTFAQQRMREAIIADKPAAAALALDNLAITIINSFEADGLTLPNPMDIQTETLGEYALQNSAPYQANVRFDPPQPVPDWLDEAYLTTMASNVDIGQAYPELIRENLIDSPAQAALQQDFYISQLRAELPMIALECKLRGIGGIDELGCRYIRQWLKPTPDHLHPILIRPLAFVHDANADGDPVTDMYIIAPRQPDAGPCLLYRPLFELPLLQFPSAQNLLYALHQPGELRDSVLAWLPDSDSSFKYAQYTFPIGLPSPWLSAQLLAEPWTSTDWAGPVELASKALEGDAFAALFKAHAQAMAELADRQSLSNAQRRWDLLRDSGWALFSIAANFLSGPAGAAVWVWQSLSEIEQVAQAHQRGDATAQWSAVGEMLLNLGMILAHHAASRRKTGLPAAPKGDHDRPLKHLVAAPGTATRPRVTLNPTPLTGELPPSHFSSLEPGGSVPTRSPSALALYLDRMTVPALDLAAPGLETLPRESASLYRKQEKSYAKVGERWFCVVEDEDQQVQIIDPLSPSKTGPLLIHNQQGQWFIDTRLRLRGGGRNSLKSQLRAQRKVKEQQKQELGAKLDAFKRQEASSNAELKVAQLELMGTSGQVREQATQRYLGLVDKLIKDYDQALTNLEQWRLKGGTDGYFNDLQRLTIELQKNLALWFALKRAAYSTLTEKLAQDQYIDTQTSAQAHIQGVRQALALSHELIARLHTSQVTLEALDATGSAGMRTTQSLRKLLPQFNQWDLKANEIGMSHEVCLRDGASHGDDLPRNAVGLLIIEAATATHKHAALIRKPPATQPDAEHIESLSRLIDVYADTTQRLADLPGEHPDKLQEPELQRVSALIGEFKQLAQEQLNRLLPTSGESTPPTMPLPAVAGPSRPVGKVSKTRPRDPAPGQTSTAAERSLEEVLPPRPKSTPLPDMDDTDIVDNALTLNEGVEAFIDRTRKDALRPNRIPADMQDLFDLQAQRLEQSANDVAKALERLRVSSGTRLPVGDLSGNLGSAALRLRAQGISVRANLLKNRQPRQAYLQWLLDNQQVRIVRNAQGRIRTQQRRDYFQEYRILDTTHNDQPLWVAHFHYDALETPADQFSAAHLKIAEPYLQQFTPEQRQALTTLAPIDYVLRRISNPSLFLTLEPKS